jgi:hypothetical protein
MEVGMRDVLFVSRDDRGGLAKWQSQRAPALAAVLAQMLFSAGDWVGPCTQIVR